MPPKGVKVAFPARRYWLMKAEPETRLEKGHDVAFSVDIFAACPKQTSCWDGVRNPEAKEMMKTEMKIDDGVLFYHSNCKLPGIAGLAKVVKQGYPDHTAWDPVSTDWVLRKEAKIEAERGRCSNYPKKHPYYDPKSDKDNPKWFMVDVQLERKLPHLVPLALLQYLSSSQCSHSLPYLQQDHSESIASMQLLNRGRLSVQRVESPAFEAICLLGEQGGWQDWPGKWKSKTATAKAAMKDEEAAKSSKTSGNSTRRPSTFEKKHASLEDKDAPRSATRQSKRQRKT